MLATVWREGLGLACHIDIGGFLFIPSCPLRFGLGSLLLPFIQDLERMFDRRYNAATAQHNVEKGKRDYFSGIMLRLLFFFWHVERLDYCVTATIQQNSVNSDQNAVLERKLLFGRVSYFNFGLGSEWARHRFFFSLRCI